MTANEVETPSTSEWRALKKQVATLAAGRPTLSDWLAQVAAISPVLAEAVEGIWTGREGSVKQMLRGGRHMLVVGWYAGRVEYSYVS